MLLLFMELALLLFTPGIIAGPSAAADATLLSAPVSTLSSSSSGAAGTDSIILTTGVLQTASDQNSRLSTSDDDGVLLGSCDVCETAFEGIAAALPANFTEKQLLAALNKACALLDKVLPPSQLPPSHCMQAAAKVASAIFGDITGEVPPLDVCTQLQLCPSWNATTLRGLVCELCEDALDTIAERLPPSFTEEDLVSLLDSGCAKITFKHASLICELLVRTRVAPVIFEDISGELPSKDVCTHQLRLCSSPSSFSVTGNQQHL